MTPHASAILTHAVLMLLIALPSVATAQIAPIDRDGRDQRVWAPDRPFDHEHLRLEITVPDMGVDRFSGVARFRLIARARQRTTLRLDAGPGLRIDQVRADGRDATFEHAASDLTITLPRAVPPGATVEIEVTYEALDPGGDSLGLTHVPDDPATDLDDPYFHSQGQTELNHLWFPCHDFPDERLTTELIADVPTGFEAVSNGRLVGIDRSPTRSVFHWSQSRPHPAYLVTFAVGRFEVVNLGGAECARPGLWMPVYGPPGSAELMRRRFANTAPMMAYFERLFDEPYPWEKYAQVVVPAFSGAMENTSASTFSDGLLRTPGEFFEPYVVHELAHQWFGNLVTCATWEHLWLNEGWATFCEALWAEHTVGQRAYLRVIGQALSAQRQWGAGSLPRTPGMTSHRYREPDDRFGRANSVYDRGVLVLHMLRFHLGDDIFFESMRRYLDRFGDASVETADYRRVLEEVSGRSLERFFDQWVHRPGHPRLDVDIRWNATSNALEVGVVQRQTIDHLNPAYAFELPLRLETGAPDPVDVVVPVSGRETTWSVGLPVAPERVDVDPYLTVIAETTTRVELSPRTGGTE